MTISYNTVITACAAARDETRALRWLSTMLEANVEINTSSYNTVIQACSEARDEARAEHWLSTMLKASVEDLAMERGENTRLE